MCENHDSTCKTCGKTFKGHPSKRNLYCTIECYRVAQRSGKYRNPENSIHKYKCAHCAADVVGRERSMGRNGKRAENIFCGRACYTEFNKVQKKCCKQCGISFTPLSDSAIFCSHGCRVEHNKPSQTTCKQCGVEFSAIKRRGDSSKWYVRLSGRKVCSSECQREMYRTNAERKRKISEAFQADKHPNWQGGTHYSGNRGAGWQRIAERCRDLHNRTCKHCGMSEDESKAKGWGRLQVNHIVPFHQWQNKSAANKQGNLEALCKSCHTKADWKWRKENPVQQSLDFFR